ncbi:MAG: DUF1786 domain-containing protein [Chloroflexota bacterium]|nr:DUF1786 domain-containing protein [Chloroflexota bacterium]
MSAGDSGTVLAVDVGAGTQDILVYDPSRTPENCFRLVMPSQTQVVAIRIGQLTLRGLPLHLAGTVMGGGASTDAVRAHLKAGLPVTATPDAARTIHNNPDRVRALGIEIVESAPAGSETINLADIDLQAIVSALSAFQVELPTGIAVAVQDHGVQTGRGNNDVRGEYLHWLVNDAESLDEAAFVEPPPAMTRMRAVLDTVPGAVVMDTGAAAVLGALRDGKVSEAAERGAVVVNIGNMHTFGVLVRGRRAYGLFEHHSGGVDASLLQMLVSALQAGDLDNAHFRERFDGHGALVSPEYRELAPFDFVAITGPNRGIARALGWYEAAPHGDMMLTGSFGLVDGYRAARGAADR